MISRQSVLDYYRSPTTSLSEMKIFNVYQNKSNLVLKFLLSSQCIELIKNCNDLSEFFSKILSREEEKTSFLYFCFSVFLLPFAVPLLFPLIKEKLLWNVDMMQLFPSLLLGVFINEPVWGED